MSIPLGQMLLQFGTDSTWFNMVQPCSFGGCGRWATWLRWVHGLHGSIFGCSCWLSLLSSPENIWKRLRLSDIVGPHDEKLCNIYIYIIQDEKRGKSKTVRAFFPSPISFEFEDPDQLRSLRGPVKAAGPLVPKPKKVSVLTPTSRTRTKQLSKKIAELWLKKMISWFSIFELALSSLSCIAWKVLHGFAASKVLEDKTIFSICGGTRLAAVLKHRESMSKCRRFTESDIHLSLYFREWCEPSMMPRDFVYPADFWIVETCRVFFSVWLPIFYLAITRSWGFTSSCGHVPWILKCLFFFSFDVPKILFFQKGIFS